MQNHYISQKSYNLATHPLKGEKAYYAPWNQDMKTRAQVLENKRICDTIRGDNFSEARGKTSASQFGSYTLKEPCARPTVLPHRDDMKKPKIYDHLDRHRSNTVYYCYMGVGHEEFYP